MRCASLTRQASTAEGTPGLLHLSREDGRTLRLHTLELPWKDNRRQISCIPAGVYRCAVVQSPRFGAVYGVEQVPGRSHILIHSGNIAGNVSQGFATHVQGCILVGQIVGKLVVAGREQKAVLQSKAGLRQLHDFMGMEPFELTLAWGNAAQYPEEAA